jgi:septum formation protein
MADAQRLILASASSARATMLRNAGLQFDAIAADVDEEAIRSAMTSESDCVEASDVALVLAQEKALAISRLYRGALVIGSDQVLGLGRRMFSKPASVAEAREQLTTLRGRKHELVAAVALAHDGQVLWDTIDSAQMSMRPFTDEFLGLYLTRAGTSVLASVGCYQLEGLGVQLFERIDGDYFTILGMPLLPLLMELRKRGAISA